MAEYQPLFQPGTAFTRKASAPIVGGQLLAISGPGLVAPTAAASASWLGVAGNDADTNDAVIVFRQGVQRLVAGVGGVTAGQTVEASGTIPGAVVAHTNGTNDVNVVGIALTTADAGALVEVKLLR